MAMFRKIIKKPDPEKEKEFRERLSKEDLSVKDKLGMILSAYAIIFIPCVLILLLFAFIMLLLSGAL